MKKIIPSVLKADEVRPSLRLFAWANIAVQIFFPLACAFTPVMAASAVEKNVTTPQNITDIRPYTLQKGETVGTIATKLKLTVPELKKLNQFRVFSKPFEQLAAGDELDIPVVTKNAVASPAVTK